MNISLKQVFNCQKLLLDNVELDLELIPERTPEVNPFYVFELETLNKVLMYLIHPFNDCLYISGPSGCGKTSIVLQIASRLGWAVEQITLSNKCESLDLIGHSTLKNGSLVFEYGALTRAMIHGEILILNEIDTMSPSDLSVLNDVLDGKPLTITQNNGEIIHPHKNFRVIATANSKGYGDETGFYNGVRVLNQAFMDRFRYIDVDYAKPAVEVVALHSACPNIELDMIKKLVTFANNIRQVIKQGIENGLTQISAPFSTRVLLKIGNILNLGIQGLDIHEIIQDCYSKRLPPLEYEYINRLANDVFGHSKEDLKETQKNDLNEQIEPKAKKTRTKKVA